MFNLLLRLFKMTKNILTKVRKWDENIGKLIVFAVTIIIAVGVLGTLAYFYNQSRQNATELSTLTSTTSSKADLVWLNFCADWDAHVNYDPIKDMYGLTCAAGVGTKAVTDVRGILSADCADSTDDQVKAATVCFKVNR